MNTKKDYYPSKDLLDTIDYETHHKFYFSLVISVSITLLTTIVLVELSPAFMYMNILVNNYLRFPFIFLTFVNNVYQVYAHVFTGSKFAGYKNISPPGSADNQSLTVFTLSNIFDILGWMSIFVYYGYAPLFLALLASAHYGSGIVSIFFNQTFQKYFIEDSNKKDENDTFGYIYWKIFRVSFVLTDAISRGYVCYIIFLEV